MSILWVRNMTSDAEESLVGSMLEENFELQEIIGTGGFACVYRAFDHKRQSLVAIKLLKEKPLAVAEEENSYLKERFIQEAQVVTSLNHPNIVKMYHFGFLPSLRRDFIVMELLRGHDLRKELQTNGPLSPERFIPLLIKALDGLQHIHNNGIVHRDLKPDNLFLHNLRQDNEELRIVDFGIARVEQNKAITLSGQVLGTNKYMAPEYLQEQLVSPALDIYQLGLIMAEALTGKAVVNIKHTYASLKEHISGNLSLPIGLLQSPLGTVLQHSLALNPKDRYQNASAFADALKDIPLEEIPLPIQHGDKITLNAFLKMETEEISSSKEPIPQKNQHTRALAIITILISLTALIVWLLFLRT